MSPGPDARTKFQRERPETALQGDMRIGMGVSLR